MVHVASVDGTALKILLVEDDADTAYIMDLLLSKIGHTVKIVGSIAETMATAVSESFDVVLCDFGLPDGDGCSLVEALREIRPIKSIAVTGHAFQSDRDRAEIAGFDEFLSKPFDMHKLSELLAKLAAEPSPRPVAVIIPVKELVADVRQSRG